MRTSDAGLRIVRKWEGLSLSAYPDPATGGEPYTIGYGLTSSAGIINVKPGMRITQDQADKYLREALVKYENDVKKVLKRQPTQPQFDAMVSLTYNIGIGNFRKSTVLRKFNAGDFAGSADAFLLFVKANGKVMKGLVNRRNDERDLFLAGTPKSIVREEPTATPKADAEAITVQPKPVYKHRRVWASIAGWFGGGGVATFAAFSGFDYRALIVLVVAVFAFVLFFWAVYRKEIEQGLFDK